MSQLVRAMERQGYLEQVPDPDDTRAKIIRMTPRGKAVKAACVEVREELNQRIAKIVGKDKSREMESNLGAVTKMFSEGAAKPS